MNGQKVDLGGDGTYNGSESKSRDTNYNAQYTFSYYCTSHSLRMWSAYRSNGSTNFNLGFIITPAALYNAI